MSEKDVEDIKEPNLEDLEEEDLEESDTPSDEEDEKEEVGVCIMGTALTPTP